MDGGFTIWLTGMSGAGKSTIARELADALRARGRHVEILDGDEVREHLSKGLGFSKEDRDTNIRRLAYVAQLLTRNGGTVIVAAISPYQAARHEARQQIGAFVEAYVRCPLNELVRRDVKGLYARALRGEISHFTGISDPYEVPLAPEITIETDRETPAESVSKVIAYLESVAYLTPANDQIAPHGGRLINCLVSVEEAANLWEHIPNRPHLTLSARTISDLNLIAIGAFSPLDGFMCRQDYKRVVETMRLANGLAWPLPVTLGVSPEEAASLRIDGEVALADACGHVIAVLTLRERFERDALCEAQAIYHTTNPAHPGVAALYREGNVLLGGPVRVLERSPIPGFERYALDPVETRRLFAEREWRTVVGFQTRNPIHRAHEYITKVALEMMDGLLLHPLVGETKADDIPADVRLRCYETLLASYYPRRRVHLAVLPAAMRYAGPREAIFHALIRKNYGCTHFIVGRDHAGVDNYYGTYDAQHIFNEFAASDLGITPLFFENAFYSRRIGGMATDKTTSADDDTRVSLSGTRVREILRSGQLLPPEFTRPEVANILIDAFREPEAVLCPPNDNAS